METAGGHVSVALHSALAQLNISKHGEAKQSKLMLHIKGMS